VSEPQRSLYVTADDRPWQERRPGVHWKVLWEEGDRKAVLMRYAPGATIGARRAASTVCGAARAPWSWRS